MKKLFCLVLTFPLFACSSNPIIEDKNSGITVSSQNEVTKKKVSQIETLEQKKETLLNYEQKEKGLYKITTDDIYLMKNYSKIVSYKIVKSTKKGQSDMHLPYYKLLDMSRKGKISTFVSWKIQIQENLSGDFSIKGKNSKGENIDQKCSTLVECFTII